MTLSQLEKRVQALERTVQELKTDPRPGSGKWWIEQAGQFANDPVYNEIVRRGRAYRESLRPKARKRRKK
jgi:hypothetical protein